MFTKHKEKLNNHLRELRKERGVTQQKLAENIGVTRQTIISIEKGSYTPSVLLAIKIARYFDQPVEKIFYYD